MKSLCCNCIRYMYNPLECYLLTTYDGALQAIFMDPQHKESHE